MDRLTNTMFIGFAVCPEWDTSIPLDLKNIHIEPIYSRHFQQSDHYCTVFHRVLNIIRQDIAFPHVYGFAERISQVMPGMAVLFSTKTQQDIHNNIVMAANLVLPPVPTISPFALHNPNIWRDIELLPPSEGNIHSSSQAVCHAQATQCLDPDSCSESISTGTSDLVLLMTMVVFSSESTHFYCATCLAATSTQMIGTISDSTIRATLEYRCGVQLGMPQSSSAVFCLLVFWDAYY